MAGVRAGGAAAGAGAGGAEDWAAACSGGPVIVASRGRDRSAGCCCAGGAATASGAAGAGAGADAIGGVLGWPMLGRVACRTEAGTPGNRVQRKLHVSSSAPAHQDELGRERGRRQRHASLGDAHDEVHGHAELRVRQPTVTVAVRERPDCSGAGRAWQAALPIAVPATYCV